MYTATIFPTVKRYEHLLLTIVNMFKRVFILRNVKCDCIKSLKLGDPCCGSGGMFVQSMIFLQAHGGRRDGLSVYGQEANSDTWKMAKINMAVRGINADFGNYHADTFTNDLHPSLRADFILANPPFNYHPWHQEELLDDVRWKYGIPPAGNANYAWIQHMIHHLAPNGKIGLVLAKELSINNLKNRKVHSYCL